MLGIIRGEVAVGGSGHDNSKASVFKQLFKSHCNTQVDILFHDAGGGNLTGITSTMAGRAAADKGASAQDGDGQKGGEDR